MKKHGRMRIRPTSKRSTHCPSIILIQLRVICKPLYSLFLGDDLTRPHVFCRIIPSVLHSGPSRGAIPQPAILFGGKPPVRGVNQNSTWKRENQREEIRPRPLGPF